MDRTQYEDLSRALRVFLDHNSGRPTRLAEFHGSPGEMRDYWLEDGLALTGIDLETPAGLSPAIGILVCSPSGARMTHRVDAVTAVTMTFSLNGDDALEIRNKDRETTILRFENAEYRISRGAADARVSDAIAAS
jgi:hypothetical protein